LHVCYLSYGRFESCSLPWRCHNCCVQFDAVRINGVWQSVPRKVAASNGPKTIAEIHPLQPEHYVRLVNAIRPKETESIKNLLKTAPICRPVRASRITPEWADQIEASLNTLRYREHLSLRLILLGYSLRDAGAIVCAADDSGRPIGGERCRQMCLRSLRRLNHPTRFERIVKRPSITERTSV